MPLGLTPNCVLALHVLDHAVDGSFVSVCVLVEWVWPSSQFEGRANRPEAELHFGGSDSFSSAAIARSDLFSKGEDEDKLLLIWRSFETWVRFTADGKFFPMPPVPTSFFVICLPDSGVRLSPRGSDFPSCFRLDFGWKCRHG